MAKWPTLAVMTIMKSLSREHSSIVNIKLVGVLLWAFICFIVKTKQTNYVYLAELSQQASSGFSFWQFEFRLKPRKTFWFVQFSSTNTTCLYAEYHYLWVLIDSFVEIHEKYAYLQLVREKSLGKPWICLQNVLQNKQCIALWAICTTKEEY